MSKTIAKVGTWDELRIHPTKLMKMVIEGKAKVVGKDKFGRHIYELAKSPESQN